LCNITLLVSQVLNANSSTLTDISKIAVYIYVDGIFVSKSPVLSLTKSGTGELKFSHTAPRRSESRMSENRKRERSELKPQSSGLNDHSLSSPLDSVLDRIFEMYAIPLVHPMY
jgi:hypothetical protein